MTSNTEQLAPAAPSENEVAFTSPTMLDALHGIIDLAKQKDQEIAALKAQLVEMQKNLDNAGEWYSGFQQLETWMHSQGLWADQDVRDGNPAVTLITGLTRNLKRIREEAAALALTKKQSELEVVANRERDVLTRAITEAATKAGLWNEAPQYGEHLLQLCEHLAEGYLGQVSLMKATQEQMVAQQQHAALAVKNLNGAAALLKRAFLHHTCSTVPLAYERYGSMDAMKAEGRSLWEKEVPVYLDAHANGAKRALELFAKQRAEYAAWLSTMPEDAFAPATHEEVLALYDKNCAPSEEAVA